MRIDESVSAQTLAMQATVGGVVKPALSGATTSPPLTTSQTMTVYLQNADVRYSYWIVIETLP